MGARVYRPLMLGLALLLLAAAADIWVLKHAVFRDLGELGVDRSNFADYGRLLLTTGTPYRAYQLAGPYSPFNPSLLTPHGQPDLYPPPFALVGLALALLPWPLWWIAPLAVIAWCVASWRPAPWSWPVLALLLCAPSTPSIVWAGASTMWVVALLAAGLRWRWPAALIVLKPSFLPLALVGARDRRWWAACAVLGAVSLLMLPLWADYLTAVRNATGTSLLYSLGDLWTVAIPVVAWAARTGGRA